MMAIDPKTAAVCAEASGFWLMKTEPSECSIDDAFAAANHAVSWFGVRNYQARNFMRDQMMVGDAVLFYHSSCPNPGIVGIARIASKPYPDTCQFDEKSDYFDPKSTKDAPRWVAVDVEALVKFPVIPVSILRAQPTCSFFDEATVCLLLRLKRKISYSSSSILPNLIHKQQT